MVMTINYKSVNSENYLTVDDYDYGTNTYIISSRVTEEPIIQENVLDISGIEEIHVPRLYCCVIDRDDNSEYQTLYTPSYGYLREDIHIENIGLKCVDAQLYVVAKMTENDTNIDKDKSVFDVDESSTNTNIDKDKSVFDVDSSSSNPDNERNIDKDKSVFDVDSSSSNPDNERNIDKDKSVFDVDDIERELKTMCVNVGENYWHACNMEIPEPSTRGQVSIRDGKVSLRVVWGTDSEQKQIVTYKFTTIVPTKDRHVSWAVHLQSQKLYLVVSSTP